MPAESQPCCSILSPGSFPHLIRAAAPTPRRPSHGQAQPVDPKRTPRFLAACPPAPGSLAHSLPCAVSARPPPAPRAPPVSPGAVLWERAGTVPSGAGLLRSQEMVQFYCTGANGTEDGTILFFLALPCSAAGALGGFFCWFVFPLCCVSSQPGQVLPLPLGLPAVSLPSGGRAAPCLSRGFFAFGCVFWLLFLISVLL